MEGIDVTVLGSVEEADEAIKAIRERRKELKAEAVKADREAAKTAKAEALAEAKGRLEEAGLEEGDTVRAILKGEEVLGEFVKETEARFVILVDGEKKTLPFDKFVGLASDAPSVSEDADEEPVEAAL